jgi:hypothetical protein
LRAALVLILILLRAPVAAAPQAELWARWAANDPASEARVDHALWSGFLARFVAPGADGVARVAYAKVGPEDRARLDAYVEALARVPVSTLARAEQRPYWINLYNALTVRVVLDAYPVASIRDIRISPGLFASGPWGKKLVRIEGEALSLDDIEHRILRPIFADPRIHYALNCASIGCPDLAREAYTREGTVAMLEAAARAFVNHPRGARIERGRLRVSSIYDWFKADFGGSDAAVIRHLGSYAAPDLADALRGIRKIDDHGYDWSLNDAAR